MLVEPADAVVLLPAQTRYEQPGGGTETSTERRILFSPEIPGRRIGEALPEWEIPMLIAERARPDFAGLIHFEDAQAIRVEMARAVPIYEGVQDLKRAGDQVQWAASDCAKKPSRTASASPVFPTSRCASEVFCYRLKSTSGERQTAAFHSAAASSSTAWFIAI